jgi:hypothetical protein
MTHARNLSNRGTDFVSVKDFGAVGDGVTDDGPAIAAAIASLPTGGTAYGGVVFFPKGIYLSANTKLVIPNGVCLKGDGPSATQIKAGNSFNQTALVENAAFTGTQEFAFVRDIWLEGNKGGGAVCSVAVLNFVGLFVNSYIRDVMILNGSNYGLRISGQGSPGGYGPLLVDNCWIDLCNNHNVFVHCDAGSSSAGTGVYLNNLTTQNVAGGKSCVYIQGNSKLFSVIIRNLHCEQGVTAAAGTYALTLDGAGDFVLDGAQLLTADPTVGGILITNSAYNLRYRFETITNINLISPLINDQKNSVQFTGGDHVTFYASPEYGIHQDRQQTLTYGATVNTDMALGNYCIIVSNTSAFTINSPTNAQIGETLTYEIVNASGGAMGTITWGANFSYRDTSWTNPANGKRRLIQFKYRQANSWAQVAPATGDM